MNKAQGHKTEGAATPLLQVSVGDGKYTVIQEADGRTHALRYGEPWRSLVGDKLVLVLAYEVEALRLAQGSDAVAQAIRDYHYALDTRQHGGVAAGKALDAIQTALGAHWVQGQELAARAALPKGSIL